VSPAQRFVPGAAALPAPFNALAESALGALDASGPGALTERGIFGDHFNALEQAVLAVIRKSLMAAQ
jgi:hypothetical protein